ncbi:putative exonuclease [Nocardioides sp. CF8]|uniref:AAA family ATPase n=1 Tax=Nocardioides sp. CF8 TaxID=110319 RepID=UPI00033125BA|nr:SMC family ATPase [Nocardioides sp. CF8]EON24018.1 putative exonuclease [Nocardioides sp. CF8]
MRLHSLSITAFGPFADTVEVDFDSLSDSGLFLLSGPTGAGKSSVLDAVCFALYGDVPGDRSTAARLRCDQAGDGVAPRVRLEVTLSGRRFRIERSPKWERPKKRGTGMTTEQASVVLSEHRPDGWQPLSTRLDETGHLVTGLVGLTLTQFCQVAMLPQGRFQAFLRARSDERHALLRQVFRTGRFDRIEQWLRDRRLDLQRSSAAHGRTVAHLAGRVSETARQPLPTAWDMSDLSLEASEGAVTRWVREHLAEATADVHASEAARIDADRLVHTSLAGLEAGLRLADRQAAHAQAADRLAEHDHDSLTDLRERLRRAERAEPLAELEAAARDDHALAGRRRREASTLTASWLRIADAGQDDVEAARLPEALAAARRALDEAEAAHPDAERLRELTRLGDDLTGTLTGAAGEVARLSTELEAAPVLLREAEDALALARAAQDRLPTLAVALRTVRERADAAAELVAVTPAVTAARHEREEAREHAARLKETWLDIREARLNGMAAEIAGALVVGADCPVCGSHEHPRPAVAAPGSPDAASERAARKDVDDAEGLLVVLDDRLRQAEALHTRLQTLADGQSAEETARALTDAERAHAETASLAATSAALLEDVTRRRAAGDALRTARDLARQRQNDLESQLALHRAEHDRLRARIDEVLSNTGCETVTALRTLRARQLDALQQACAAHEQLALAERDLARAERALVDAAAGAGFASVDDARAARADDRARAALVEEIARIDEDLRAARAVTEDADHREAAALPRPDVDVLTRDHADAESSARAAHARHDEAVRRHERLTTLADEVSVSLAAWAPVRDELALTARLAHFVEGKSPDNALQMRLSAYVLAHRLTQVVAAANERLARMSDQRYSLEHTGKRGAGESRGGLSLLVRDDWSGEARDPATLSGGETFVVSLALALGLADVITQEAGGADLDTLFVDEGFGSLDADTLDDVMDTLDGLRDGGRVVGVVSHVAEMQTRIPSQLRVTKGRDGSRVSVSIG